MIDLKGARIGCAMTGSFCMFEETFKAYRALRDAGAELFPIMSENAYSLDTRYYEARKARRIFEEVCGREILHTIQDAEPIGPRKLFDLIIVAPATGNTLAKLANGISDTSVTLAVKSHLRNGNPALLAISTNDGLARNARNIGALMAMRHFYFVPYCQDAPDGKPTSVVAHMALIPEAAASALNREQLQPILRLS